VSIRIIGHRGALDAQPENTLRSFRHAEAVGADDIELDVRLSADGHLVVLHDATVDRTTDGTGEVAALTLDALRRLDAGLGERIPTLAEVLAAVALPIQVEVKAVGTVPALAALVAEQPSVAGRIVFSSFHGEFLAALAAAVPAVDRMLIRSRATADLSDLADRAAAVGASWVAPGLAHLTADLVAGFAARGLRIDAWPAPDPEALQRAIDLGADAVTTDHPELLRSWLDTRSANVG
jgi:glycerophosphoryl diester phosphodiesterase